MEHAWYDKFEREALEVAVRKEVIDWATVSGADVEGLRQQIKGIGVYAVAELIERDIHDKMVEFSAHLRREDIAKILHYFQKSVEEF